MPDEKKPDKVLDKVLDKKAEHIHEFKTSTSATFMRDGVASGKIVLPCACECGATGTVTITLRT